MSLLERLFFSFLGRLYRKLAFLEESSSNLLYIYLANIWSLHVCQKFLKNIILIEGKKERKIIYHCYYEKTRLKYPSI
jgi:hypothetical protein